MYFSQRPLDFGADISVSSLTKYINGHSDVLMGMCVTNCGKLHKSLIISQRGTPLNSSSKRLLLGRETHYATYDISFFFITTPHILVVGSIPSPFDCYMVLRGLRTLSLRMDAHMRNAYKVVKFLDSHSAITKVIYPGKQFLPCKQCENSFL